MPRSTLQPLARNRPNTNINAPHSARLAERNRPKPCSTIKCNRLLRCRVATAFFVCTWLPMVADGAGIEIVFICRFVSIVGRKKNGCHLPLLINQKTNRVGFDFGRGSRRLYIIFVYEQCSGYKKIPVRGICYPPC